MNNRKIIVNLTLFICISIVVTAVFYFFNVWFMSLPSFRYLNSYYSPTDGLFFEGLLFLIFGVLLLTGRGGIDLWTLKAAILSALAGAAYGDDAVGPSEIMRRDSWKPQGFVRFALVLILAGLAMILVSLYFQYV